MINHAGCWENRRKDCKSPAEGEWFTSLSSVKFHKMTSYTWIFQNFTFVLTVLVKFDIYFLGLLWEIVFGVITDNKLYLLALEKCKKENAVKVLSRGGDFLKIISHVGASSPVARSLYARSHHPSLALLACSRVHQSPLSPGKACGGGRGFCAVLVWKRVYTLVILVCRIWYGFRENYGLYERMLLVTYFNIVLIPNE